MREIAFASLIAAATVAFAAPAAASSEVAQVELCAAALDAQGVAAASDYRARFVKSKGGAVKTVTVRLIPTGNGAQAKTAECQIRRGEVVEASIIA